MRGQCRIVHIWRETPKSSETALMSPWLAHLKISRQQNREVSVSTYLAAFHGPGIVSMLSGWQADNKDVQIPQLTPILSTKCGVDPLPEAFEKSKFESNDRLLESFQFYKTIDVWPCDQNCVFRISIFLLVACHITYFSSTVVFLDEAVRLPTNQVSYS